MVLGCARPRAQQSAMNEASTTVSTLSALRLLLRPGTGAPRWRCRDAPEGVGLRFPIADTRPV